MKKKDRQKNIAFILPNFRGKSKRGVPLVENIIEKGYSVELVIMESEGMQWEYVPPNASVVILNIKRLSNLLLPLIKYLRKKRPDAIRVGQWPLTVITTWARFFSGVDSQLVISEHTTFSLSPVYEIGLNKLLMPLTMRYSYGMADYVVGISKGVTKDLEKLSGKRLLNARIIYKGAAPSREMITETKPDNEFWENKNAFKIIAVGNLKKAKDYPTLISAFELLQRNINTELVILGEGGERNKIEIMIKKKKLGNVIHLPGFVSNPIKYLKTADIFVLSSAWEGFAKVIVEALACGIPVVSTDCKSGPREILEDGKYGNLVPVGDLGALASAILHALEKKYDPQKLKERAQYFSVERAANEYLKLLFPDDS